MNGATQPVYLVSTRDGLESSLDIEVIRTQLEHQLDRLDIEIEQIKKTNERINSYEQ